MEAWLKALKIFVVVAGIVLVVGTATLIGLLIQRGGSGDVAGRGDAPLATLADTLSLPPGTRIAQTELDGQVALLLLTDTDQQQYLLLVNLTTGERLGLLRAVPGGP